MKLLNLRNYRKQIAYVKQKSIFYQDSIYNNLELANKRKKLTVQKEVKRVNAPEEEAKELMEEEVNLYGNCGKDKYRCHNDCIIPFTSLLNSSL